MRDRWLIAYLPPDEPNRELRKRGKVVSATGDDLWLAGIEARAADDGFRCEVPYEMYLNDILAAIDVRLLDSVA